MKISIWHIPTKRYLSDDELVNLYYWNGVEHEEHGTPYEDTDEFKFNLLTGKVQLMSLKDLYSDYRCCNPNDIWTDSSDFIVFYDNKESL